MIDLPQKVIKIEGKKIAYYDEGSSEKRVVICLHGWGGNKETFSKLIRKLDPYFRVISLDLPGHGDSEPIQGQDFMNYVNIIKKFVDERWKGKISMVGFSLGGVLSLMYALKYPEKVDKLVIWESSTDFKGLKRYRILGPWLALLNNSRNLSKVVCYLGTCKVGHKLISTLFSGEIADSMRIADGHTLVSLACEAVHMDFPKGLKNLDKNVMLVSDYKEDIHIPKRKMYELMELLPRASLVEVEGSRHYARDRSKVYEKIVEFLVKTYV